MIEIPVDTKGGSSVLLSCNVGGVSLSVRLLWNERDGHWFADLESSEGKNAGIRLVPGTPLLSSGNRVLAGGDIAVLATPNVFAGELGYGNLGTDYALMFVSDDDIAELWGF